MTRGPRDTGWFKSSFSGGANDNCVEVRWTKSTFSGAANDNCVEVGWVKSSFSGAANDDCVEVRFSESTIAVRDSKNPGPRFSVSPTAWSQLMAAITR
ncbi:DUF397 domain-containing protein [Actinokineospora sp. NBRC 105648]|uniref:DUF397 domain-containing protein n=1 Tax=Actinokineospora sp. NBRC 105648 TaxID=3032206 RepID=UPI0024A51FB4|nr:DUF397 domain-containing protein [Actinokineospora sp. NBRC 105648]GLZ41183.1 toxin [Actinokineospora sp. NBRC 105648]